MKTTGGRIQLLRDDLDLTKTALAERVNDQGVSLDRSYITRIEKTGRAPSGEIVAALAKVLGTSTDFLLMLTDDSAPPKDEEEELEEKLRILRDPASEYITGERIAEAIELFEALPEDDQDYLLKQMRILRDANTPRIVGLE